MEVSDSIEVHTVELAKYNLREETIGCAPAIEQWAFFFLFADRYEPEELRELLAGGEFQQAISVVEAIAAKTEDRMMYDQRLKAQRDYQSSLPIHRAASLPAGLLLARCPTPTFRPSARVAVEEGDHLDPRHHVACRAAMSFGAWILILRAYRSKSPTFRVIRFSIPCDAMIATSRASCTWTP